MEVIKEVKWVKDYTCSGVGNRNKGCGSLLRVEKDDLRYFEEQEYPWRIQPEAVCFKCPVCHAITDIPEEHWPAGYVTLEKWTSKWRDSHLKGE